MNQQEQPRKIDRKARMALPPAPARVRPPQERVRDFEETVLLYTPEEAQAEARRCLQCPTAPCRAACPLHNDIPRALSLLESGRIEDAANVYRETNPMPEICGRVCPDDFCASACTLGKTGQAIDTRHLEAFVATMQRMEAGVVCPVRAPLTGKRVAVIGAGPAGLTAASELARRGHQVTVYEQHAAPGGVLFHGIPGFKLGLDVVDAQMGCLEALGITFHYNTRVGRDITLQALREQYDAVFIGVGTPHAQTPGMEGEHLTGVYTAADFLMRAKHPHKYDPVEFRVGPRIHVLGGGDTAMDCLRTAVRLPGVSEVACYYRRSAAEMPAHRTDYTYALEEGAQFHWLCNPLRILGDETGKVTGVLYQRMELGEPDESGRSCPMPVDGSEFSAPAETVVLALGYTADRDFATRAPELKVGRKGLISVDDESTGRTNLPGVFAAGDAVRGADLVAPAIAAALKVVAAIDSYLCGEGQA